MNTKRTIQIATLALSLTLPAFAQKPRIEDKSPPVLRIVERPTYRIEPFKEGNTIEGHLYFEAVLENVTDDYVKAGASFTLYLNSVMKDSSVNRRSRRNDLSS